MRLRSVRAVALLLPILLAGCGKVDHFGEVSGTVSYKGKRIPAGTVTFHGADGRVETAQIQPDGTYRAPKVLVGPTRVTVETPNPSRLSPALAKAMKEGDEQAMAAARRDGATIVPSVPIPEKYKNPDQSELKLDIMEGSQVFEIPLS